MKTIMTKTMTAMMVLFLTGTMAFSQPPAGKAMKGMPQQAPQKAMMQKMLDLTPEQMEQMKQMRLEMTKEMLPLRNDMAILKAEYRKLITAEKPSQKEINANIDKQTALINKMKKVRASHMLKMRDILTEEQWLMIQSHRGMQGKGAMRGGAGHHGMKRSGAGPCGRGMTPPAGMQGRPMGMGMMPPSVNDK
jgi:Spy/CpxP family protein refolding chaperone